jgi:hypothetical protein
MITRGRIPECAPFVGAVKMRLSVRPAYRRQETLLSCRGVVLTLRFQGPQAVEKCRAEVDRGTTSTADGPPAAVTLDVVVAVGGVREVVGCILCRAAGAYWLRPRWTGQV